MRIVWMSDFDLRGSGYMNLSVPLCSGLVGNGHIVKAVGLGYQGDEHFFPFTLLPANTVKEAVGITQNLYNTEGFDVLIVALDIPLQERLIQVLSQIERQFAYVGIMPIEADPLTFSWAMVLAQMDKALIISQFGADEANKIGVEAEHLQIGIDTTAWTIPDKEQKQQLRGAFGFEEDTFAILTVADNQERKNLAAAFKMFAKFTQDDKDARYVLVTREHNPVGWKLRDLASEPDYNINDKLIIFERGLAFRDLWAIYAACDLFLLPSKAEGLGLPILEAMAAGLPVMATDCTGMKELIEAGGGFQMEYNHVHRDPFGNGRRYWVDIDKGAELLQDIYERRDKLEPIILGAREYIEGRQWEITIEQLERAVQEAHKSHSALVAANEADTTMNGVIAPAVA